VRKHARLIRKRDLTMAFSVEKFRIFRAFDYLQDLRLRKYL